MKRPAALLWLILFSWILWSQEENPIIDSAMSFDASIAGTKAPQSVLDNLTLIDVEYRSFDGRLHRGQLLLHKRRVPEIEAAFKFMLQEGFPVEKCIPIVQYGWSDDASMADNNTSMFNYRNIAGSDRLSNHALGLAIDLNPSLNPAVYPDGRISPPGARYRPDKPGTLSADSALTRFFKERGWSWGGDWTHVKDWQHFDHVEN